MEVKDRIKALIGLKAKSERDFAIKIGISQATLNNYMLGKRKISLELVEAVLKSFPDVSADWFLRGLGEMLNSENDENVENVEVTAEPIDDETFYKRIIDEQLDTISGLKKRVALLEAKLSDEDKSVAS